MSSIKFTNNSAKFKAELKRKKPIILNTIGLKAVSIWQKIITAEGIVDTGRFRNGCKSEVEKDAVIIGNNVEYAPYLETGTSRRSARPSLKPTILDYKEDYKKIAQQIMKG